MFSHSCPDLTLIDLPGITRIPLANSDQKQDIEKITKEMAALYDKNSYIQHVNYLISLVIVKIQEQLFYVLFQLMLICQNQMVFKWQDN